jgi:hypothetical protein
MIKEIINFLSDRKIIIGIGIGMIITSILMTAFGYNNISNEKIEEKARALGMHYEDECKVLFEGEK